YGNERGLASLADFLFRHPPTTKWGISVERVSGDAVAHAPLIVVEKVGRHDLEIVPRRVREPTPAIAVAHRADARDAGVQLVDHLDMAARVGDDAGLVEPKVVRVRPPTGRDQHVRSNYICDLPLRLDLHGDRISLFLRTDHLAVNPHVNAFIIEKICNSLR